MGFNSEFKGLNQTAPASRRYWGHEYNPPYETRRGTYVPVKLQNILGAFVIFLLRLNVHLLTIQMRCLTTAIINRHKQTIYFLSIVNPTRCTIFRVSWILLYMFWTVFPTIIRSSRLYIQHQVYVIQVPWLHASGLVPASKQSTNLYDIYLMLYVQSWTPDDGRKDRPKHVEWYSINSKNCAASWFYYRNISRCTVPWTPYTFCGQKVCQHYGHLADYRNIFTIWSLHKLLLSW